MFATSLPQSPSGLHIAASILVVYANSIVWHTGVALMLSHRTVQAAYMRNLALLTKASAGVVSMFGLRLIVGTVQELRNRGTAGAA